MADMCEEERTLAIPGHFEEALLLPPPAFPLESSEAIPLLLAEVFPNVALYLDAVDLCRVDYLTSCCRQPRQVEAGIWAQLCILHFPTMFESVLADIERGRPQDTSNVTAEAGACRKQRRSAKKDAQQSNGPAPRRFRESRALRRQQAQMEQEVGEGYAGAALPSELPLALSSDSSPVLSPSVLVSPDATPTLLPNSPPLTSPDSTPTFLPNSPPLTSADATPTFLPSSPPPISPNAFKLLLSDGSSPSLASVDWRSLYSKRWQKKAEWKKSGRQRSASGISENACSSAGGESRRELAGASQLMVSDLTQRQLGCLSTAACRIKVCSLCGEKFSPGESRGDPTSCCFHPGDFTPSLTQGWSRQDLKQLTLTARQALRSAGGASWVQRNPRASRGHGHWMKGLGVYSKDMQKIRFCLEGEFAATWSCCDAGALFAQGCQRGMHRHFH